MADKNVSINVQLKLDSEAFSRKVEGLSGSFKPIEVPVKLQSLGLNAGISSVKVKADIDPNAFSASLKNAFSGVTAKLGEDIGEQVGKSVEKLKPSAFSNIMGAIASPFQQLATGALEGLGRELTVKLGQGLSKGIEKQVSPAIGSFELLGEQIINKSVSGILGSDFAKNLNSLLDKELKIGKDKVIPREVLQNTVNTIKEIVGDTNIILETESANLRQSLEQQRKLNQARKQLTQELLKFTVDAQANQQKAQELTTQDTQLAQRQTSLKTKAESLGKRKTAKVDEITKRRDEIVKSRRDAGVEVSEEESQNILQSLISESKTLQELKQLDKDYSTTLQALVSVTQQRKKIQEEVKKLSEALSPAVTKLEKIGVNSPDVAQVGTKLEEQSKKDTAFIEKVKASIESEQSRIKELQKTIEYNKKRLQELVDNYQLELQFTSTDAEKRQLQQKFVADRKEIVAEIDTLNKQVEKSRKNIQQKIDLGKKAAAQQEQNQADITKEYIPAQVKLTRELVGGKSGSTAPKQATGEELFPDAFAVKQAQKQDVLTKEESRKTLEALKVDKNLPNIGKDFVNLQQQYGLSDEEIKAVRLYTKSGFRLIQDYLRGGKTALEKEVNRIRDIVKDKGQDYVNNLTGFEFDLPIDEIEKHIVVLSKTIKQALSKIDNYEGILFRVEGSTERESDLRSRIATMAGQDSYQADAFTSTSLNPIPGKAHYVIKSKTSKLIEPLGAEFHPSGQSVYSPGQKFKVVSMQDASNFQIPESFKEQEAVIQEKLGSQLEKLGTRIVVFVEEVDDSLEQAIASTKKIAPTNNKQELKGAIAALKIDQYSPKIPEGLLQLQTQNQLTDEEIKVVQAYTMGPYRFINAYLREGREGLEKELERLRKGNATLGEDKVRGLYGGDFNVGIDELEKNIAVLTQEFQSIVGKLPNYEGLVFRGEGAKEDISSIQARINDLSGKSSEAFTSFGIESGFAGKAQYAIKSKSGKMIQIPGSSTVDKAGEVVYGAGSQFKVVAQQPASSPLNIPASFNQAEAAKIRASFSPEKLQELGAEVIVFLEEIDNSVEQAIAATQQILPKTYTQIAARVAELSGVKFDPKNIPSIGTDARVPLGGAAYNKKDNKILLDQSSFNDLLNNNPNFSVVENLVHELRHAFQFEFGKNKQGTGVGLVSPNAQELEKLKGRILASVKAVSSNASPEQKQIFQKTEIDAYTFAKRYAEEIYDFVTGITDTKNIPSLKTKLTERQRQLNTVREQSQEQLFLSLTEENKAALEQLTGKQLQAIAKSSGITGTSGKKVAEMRQMLLQQVNPEDLSFRIPLFSKVDPQVQQDAQDLVKLPYDQMRQEVGDTNRYFGQAIKTAAKKGKPEQQQELRLVLDGIAEARKVYASALAQDIDAQTRGLLQAAIATLGKQRIAAQNRLTNLNSTTSRAGTANNQPQSAADLQFAFPSENNEQELRKTRASLKAAAQQREKRKQEFFQMRLSLDVAARLREVRKQRESEKRMVEALSQQEASQQAPNNPRFVTEEDPVLNRYLNSRTTEEITARAREREARKARDAELANITRRTFRADLSFETAQAKHSQRLTPPQTFKPDLSFETAQIRRDLRAEKLKTTVENADTAQQDTAKLIEQINQQFLQGLISADKATKKIADLTRKEQVKQDKAAQKQQAAITKNSEASFKQAQQALKQIEEQTNQQVFEIEQRTKYKEQQQQRKQRDRLRSYGIDQTAPVDIVEQRPEGKPFSISGLFNKLRGEFQDFRASGARKQAEVLGQQAQAVLVDLDSQIAIGRSASKESRMLEKQIAENEKRIRQILGKVKAAREGRAPALTSGDLQRLAGQVQELSAQVDADRQRVAELQPQIEQAKRVQPVARDLRGATKGATDIASQKNVTGEDVGRLNQFNQQIRRSLELLGQTPGGGGGGFLADLNLKMPGLLKNVFSLVKGFLAFQVIGFVQQQLQQIGAEAFQTSLRFQALEQSLRFASGSSQSGAENLAFVRAEVERLSLPLERSIKAFTGLTAASRGTALEGAQTREIFISLAQAARVYNLSAEQVEGALLAVQQMISKGTVNAEELRGQLGERLPGAFQIAARAMGVTTAELSKMLELGQITSEEFLPKFAKQLASETSGGVAGASGTAAAAVQRLENSFTNLKKEIGDAISPAVTAVLDGLASSLDWVQKNSKLVKAALAAIALTATVALIPSITALGTAIWTLATVTFPLAAKAMLAVVAANPVLIASLAALTVGMLIAEDGAKALASALTGVSESQIQQIDADALIDDKYSKAIQQLSKQVPLTKQQVDELTQGLADQEKRGLNTSKTTQLLTNQLLKAQAQAEATAKAQAELNKRLAESELAFKRARGAAELYATENAKNVAQIKARGQLGEDAIRDREFQAEQQQNSRLSQLYSSRITEIRNLLTDSEKLRKAGRKGLDVKEEIKLNEELISVQREFNQAQTALANSQFTRTKEIRDRYFKDFDEAQSILESRQKAGIITEERLLQKRLEVQQRKGEEQLRDIAERRSKLDSADKEGLEALFVEEATAQAQIRDAQKNAFDQRLALSQKRMDQELAIAQASRSKGLINETQFNQQQYDIKVKYLDDQLAVLKERSKTISKTDIDAQNEVKAKEAQILQQRTDARKAFMDAQLARLQREQQKATDLTTLATKEREIELQKLVNARVIRQEEIQSETLKVAREGIEKELELEQQKLQQLEAFPRYDDPIAEEGRQTQIRQSRIRTSDLQLRLLQNEKAQQEAVFAVYTRLLERAKQAIANRATAATQSFNKELLANSALEKSLQLQNQLLDAQKSLRSALSSYIDAEFQILKESTTNEREKKKLAETQASIKLQAAKQQAELDKQSLELQILQTEQAQKRLEAENAIAQIRNRADVATKQAELAKVQADPNATPEQIEAARLQVVAAQAEGEGLQQQAGFLAQQRGVNAQVNQMRRQAQEAQSGTAITQAEFEAANNIADPRERRRALRRLGDRSRERVFGTGDKGEASSRMEDFNKRGRGEALTPLESYRANIVQNRVLPALPQIELPKLVPMLDNTVTNLGTAVDSLVKLVEQKLSTPNNVTIATPINNYFSATANPRDIANANTQATRKELYDLGLELKKA